MMEILENKIDTGDGIVDVNDVFQRLTLDTIGQCALAINVNCQVVIFNLEKKKLMK